MSDRHRAQGSVVPFPAAGLTPRDRAAIACLAAALPRARLEFARIGGRGRRSGAVLRIGGRELRFERHGGVLVVRDATRAAVVAQGRAAEDVMASAWKHLLAP